MSSKKSLGLTVSLFVMTFAYALSSTMTGPLVPIFINQYGINLADGAWINGFMNIGGIISILLGFIISDLLKKSVLIRLSTFLYSVSLIVMYFMQTYALLLVVSFFIGAGTKLLDAMVNAAVSESHPDKRGFYMNLLHALYALGAVIGPIFTSYLLSSGFGWNYVYLALGVFCMAVSIFYAIAQGVAKNEAKPVKTRQKQNLGQLLTSKNLLILCVVSLLYSGLGFVFATWMPMFLQGELSAQTMLSSLPASIFWVGILVGRLSNLALSKKFSVRSLLIAGGLAASLFMGLSVIINTAVMYTVLFFFVGFALAPFIPYAVMLGSNWYPQNTGAVSSIIFLSTTLGGLLLPWIFGVIGGAASLYTGLAIFIIIPVLILVFTIALPKAGKAGRRRSKK